MPSRTSQAASTELGLITSPQLLSKLHDTVMDATARDRIYSRRELRRRASHLNRKLRGLLDLIGQMG